MRLRYTREALADLDAALEHSAKHWPQVAERVQGRIQTLIHLLLQHPHIGQLTSRRGMRRLIASPYPYLIFYRATEDEIIIHGVRHSARRPSTMPR